MGKVAFAEPAEQMTDEVLCGWDTRLYRDRGAKHIVRGPHPTSLRSATFPKGEGFGIPCQHLDKSEFERLNPHAASCATMNETTCFTVTVTIIVESSAISIELIKSRRELVHY